MAYGFCAVTFYSGVFSWRIIVFAFSFGFMVRGTRWHLKACTEQTRISSHRQTNSMTAWLFHVIPSVTAVQSAQAIITQQRDKYKTMISHSLMREPSNGSFRNCDISLKQNRCFTVAPIDKFTNTWHLPLRVYNTKRMQIAWLAKGIIRREL